MIAIIGSGPAGISAALYIKRANIPLVIFSNHKSSLEKAASIENYYGTGKVSGKDIYEKGLESIKNLGVEIIDEEILNISFDDSFKLESKNNKYYYDTIILATGSPKRKLNISGLNRFEGKGISYCATCDGYFFKNKKIAVIGNGDYANHEYNYLKNISADVIQLDVNDILSFNGDSYLSSISLINETVDIDGVFIAVDYPDSSELAKKIGLIQKDGRIIVDEYMKTNVPGIFACGDTTPGPKQIAKAVYEGMVAANSAIEYYKKKKN